MVSAGETLRPGLNQLCKNAMGHLTSIGVYPALQVSRLLTIFVLFYLSDILHWESVFVIIVECAIIPIMLSRPNGLVIRYKLKICVVVTESNCLNQTYQVACSLVWVFWYTVMSVLWNWNYCTVKVFLLLPVELWFRVYCNCFLVGRDFWFQCQAKTFCCDLVDFCGQDHKDKKSKHTCGPTLHTLSC